MLTKLKIFAVGNKTASACKKYWNITVNTDEGVHNAEQLLNTLVFSEKDRVLFPRSTKALPTVETVLAQRKVAYLAPCAYHTKNAHPDVRFLAQQKFDGICFFSPSAVEFFLASLREHQLSLCLLQSVAVACIGETTARYAALHNVTNIVSAKKPSIAAVIDALGEFYA